MKTNRLIHIEPVETIRVACPKCAAALGTIDVQNLAWRRLWARENSPLPISVAKDPQLDAAAGLIRGACPSCSAQLAEFWVFLDRNRGAGAATRSPRLSAATHNTTFTGWTMIEHLTDGFDVITHCFGPILDEQVDETFERISAILNDLPCPEAEAA